MGRILLTVTVLLILASARENRSSKNNLRAGASLMRKREHFKEKIKLQYEVICFSYSLYYYFLKFLFSVRPFSP